MLPSTMATSNNIPRGYLLKSVGSTHSLHTNNDNPQSRLDAVQTRGVSPWSRGTTRVGALLPAREDGHSDVDLGPTSWTGLHKLWYPVVRDRSTWSKFGAHGEHGDVFLFYTLGAL